MDFRSGEELLKLCEEERCTIGEVMLRRETRISGTGRDVLLSAMERSYSVMKDAVKKALDSPAPSMGGLIGGEAAKMRARRESGRPVCGTLMSKAAGYAMGVTEVNASMGLIVAAPTAGSSGVIPGAFMAVQEEFSLSDSAMVMALFNAAAVGYLIMRNATVSGAQGGCQAEVGSASAMAASALAELMGAEPAACLSAASSALANLLGLICDPIAGLVEAPCQKRNALGASNAMICAEMALSGITEIVPFDEMVDTMNQVGQRIPVELRETALGGIAASPTGCRLCATLKKSS
ncbi:L-serine ammonia-lyase, iron-sulfur-dependent, subunit alpha [Breznakiella homolactica]|uniref:L-serine dehydratase n=1 Tax=Breznakiella homolactica TaxID=2798577 RepID=A0A7T8BAM5_9SPIR|nr:L-serine ammonia-lyase, iron-sulfur-dependent, subunit alpha [Breznakiella homolactica]QQO08358.1 L-serine ammonia-lyase, iron-sulfur-dependent, subunit alpha [Breznakiella homolactica]